MSAPLCPYCGAAAQRTTGAVLYPHRPDLAHKQYWQCAPCDAHVGCHPDGRPMGRLADGELREAKRAAHAAFDTVWQGGRWTRTEAYRQLAAVLGINVQDCHIGEFDVAMCQRVVAVIAPRRPGHPARIRLPDGEHGLAAIIDALEGAE